MYKIIMSFDYGTKNIGVAIGQNITYTSTPIESIPSIKEKPNWFKIKKIIEEWYPKLIIIGYPLNMDNTKQNLINKVINFKKNIKCKFNIKVNFQDERLTSFEAKNQFFIFKGRKPLKGEIDSISASLILNDWLKKNIN